jgi:hypothetical protein
MVCARYLLTLCAVFLGLLASADATAQAKSPADCQAAIERAEKRIADARRRPEYKTEKGRHNLSSADRYVNQARNHAKAGESRNCVTAAQKAGTQLSAR